MLVEVEVEVQVALVVNDVGHELAYIIQRLMSKYGRL